MSLTIDVNAADASTATAGTAAAAASSSPVASPLSSAHTPTGSDQLADSMELLATSASNQSSTAASATAAAACTATRPLSPLTECRPSSATADAAMPLLAPAAAGASAARCATPPVLPGLSPRNSPNAMVVDDQNLCKVCFVSEINTVLLPCAHVAVCVECSTQLQRCCICRANITDAIQTFKA
jgi:hypothetical protein